MRALGRLDDEQLLDALAFGSRDNARTPVQWDASPKAGFTTGEPWIGINPNAAYVNAAAERADEASVFHHYRRLIALRHDEPVVRWGDFALLVADDPHVYAFTRTLDDDALAVFGNFTGEQRTVEAPLALSPDAVVLGNYADPVVASYGHVTLRPWEAVVFRI